LLFLWHGPIVESRTSYALISYVKLLMLRAMLYFMTSVSIRLFGLLMLPSLLARAAALVTDGECLAVWLVMEAVDVGLLVSK